MRLVFDSSAILAVVFGEPGAERVARHLLEGRVGAVNFAEVATKLVERGWSREQIIGKLAELGIGATPFEAGLAIETGLLRAATRTLGLSLGDRACLALARAEGATVMTADRSWAGLDVGVTIEVIR